MKHIAWIFGAAFAVAACEDPSQSLTRTSDAADEADLAADTAPPPSEDAEPDTAPEPDADEPTADAAETPPDADEPTPDAGPDPDNGLPPDAAEPDKDALIPADGALPGDAGPADMAILPDMPPPPPPDLDMDGWDASQDCDDDDPNRHPGAPELQNGIDDDCDGHADEIQVCADGVAEFGSIQAALDAVPDGATIELCPGVYDENINITRPVSIFGGGGVEGTIIDGGARSSTVTVGGGGLAEISISALTIRNGSAAEGGGVRCDNGILFLTGVRVTGNQATHGAGIHARSCRLSIAANEIDNNTAADEGGGVRLDNSQGEVGDNDIHDNAANQGGGVAVVEGEALVRGNDIHHNRASEEGGGHWHNSNAQLDGNTIRSNHCDFEGGGLYVTDGRTAVVSNNLIDENHCSGDGGGIYLSRNRVIFEFNRVTSNVADDDGGGLRIFVSQAVARNNEMIGNRANDDGGGIKISHNISALSDNYVDGNEAGDKGGGIELDNDFTNIDRDVYVNNIARMGGAIHASTAHQGHYLNEVRIENNQATNCGGGIYLNDETHPMVIRRTEFVNNLAPMGGALCASQILYELHNVLFAGNLAEQAGGAIYHENSDATVRFATFSDNGAEEGGAIRATSRDGMSIEMEEDDPPLGHRYNRFSMNSSIVYRSQFGAAVSIDLGPPTWQNNDVFGSQGVDFFGFADPTGSLGNISEDPNFADADQRDFHLIPPSACIDAGDANAFDQDGSRADMGYFGGPEAP